MPLSTTRRALGLALPLALVAGSLLLGSPSGTTLRPWSNLAMPMAAGALLLRWGIVTGLELSTFRCDSRWRLGVLVAAIVLVSLAIRVGFELRGIADLASDRRAACG